MDKETLIKELARLAELNETTNPCISSILYTLASLCMSNDEELLFDTFDKVNDIFINQLKQIKHEN